MTPESRSQTLEYDALDEPSFGRSAVEPRLVPKPRPEDVRTRDIAGIPIAMTDYAETMDVMDGLIERREQGYVCAVATHAVMVAYEDEEMRQALTGSSLTVPDGMPLVWAANMLGDRLDGRVYGPELMKRYSRRCAERGYRVWLYGGRDQGSLAQLALNLRRENPDIKIVGGYCPPYRDLDAEEERALFAEIDRAQPDVLWIGTGVPRQEKWMAHI